MRKQRNNMSSDNFFLDTGFQPKYIFWSWIIVKLPITVKTKIACLDSIFYSSPFHLRIHDYGKNTATGYKTILVEQVVGNETCLNHSTAEAGYELICFSFWMDPRQHDMFTSVYSQGHYRGTSYIVGLLAGCYVCRHKLESLSKVSMTNTTRKAEFP